MTHEQEAIRALAWAVLAMAEGEPEKAKGDAREALKHVSQAHYDVPVGEAAHP